VPYQTVTPSETPTVIPPLVEVVMSTPTTLTYTVVQGDTLIGIAGRFGVALEALLAANPQVQPSSLMVGTTLVIPTGSEISGESTSTPAPLPIRQVHCWSEIDGGMWCFALVQNEYSETLENLSAQFTLFGDDGNEFASQVAYALLNTLPPGQSIPLVVYFPPLVPVNVSVRAQVVTAIRLLPGDTRYLPVMVENALVSVDASGRTAQSTGRVILTGTVTAEILWILAIAYDTAGNVVGVRRWESQSALSVDTPVSFDFQVSSVGPSIDRVEFLAEARP